MNRTGTTSRKFDLLLGAHFSIAKGLHDAVYQAGSYGCPALQMFTQNATTWKERTISQAEQALFEKAKAETNIHIIASHTSYLINLASPESKKRNMSYRALKQELRRSSYLNIPYCVLHPGAHMDSGTHVGIMEIARSINRLFSETPEVSTRLLLETTAGQGSNLGHTFEELAKIIQLVDQKERLGICLDTCHIFAAGYDIRTPKAYQKTLDHFNAVLGLDRLCVIHVNDSKKGLGSRIDRHTHIGKGAIGLEAFKLILNDERLFHIPKLLETKKMEGNIDWHQKNLKQLRALVKRRL